VEVPVRQAAKDKGGFGGRTEKKLRLSKEQYGFLEDRVPGGQLQGAQHRDASRCSDYYMAPFLSKRNYMSCCIFGKES